ncbi:MAG: GTPase HflX [Nitrososphaerales archaeon]
MANNAILITYPQPDSIKEALALADAAGYNVIKVVTQKYLSKSRYGIGSGKAEEVKNDVEELKANVIIFDEVLRSTQVYNLARLLQIQIIDRERLILEIFERRASSAESRIQVKLAQLRYEMTRAREKVRLAKLGEQPGFFGLGRYEVDNYYRDIKRRISTLKQKLGKVSNRRDLFRYQRIKQGFPLVLLAGYTASGKTTLFNLLTGENHDIGKGMFTTLATYTRALALLKGKVLVSDTVGFISKLPAYMIEAFKSTLDELTYANIVLLIIDINGPLVEVARKYDSCLEILNELHVPQTKVLNVLNKIDLTSEEDAMEKVKQLGMFENRRYIMVSAKTGHNVECLKELINSMVFEHAKVSMKVDQKGLADNSESMELQKDIVSINIDKQFDGTTIATLSEPSGVVDSFNEVIENEGSNS